MGAASRDHYEEPYRPRTAPATRAASRPARRGAPGAMLALQRAAGNRAVQRLLQRKEVAGDAQISGPHDWTTFDRIYRMERWKQACLTNLNAIDSGQYRAVVERRDFYWWFYRHTMDQGYTTRWPLAAAIVANGAHLIADMNTEHPDAEVVLDLSGPELQGYMREGNQVIFDNVLPKLKQLVDGGPLQGRAALQWDMQTLAEEQALVQPMYARMSEHAFDQLNYIARKKRAAGIGAWLEDEDLVEGGPYVAGGRVPEFDEDTLHSIEDRWRYGMKLGDEFTPGGTGFDPGRDKLPAVPGSYTSGAEFSKVDWRSHLHYIDAWLDPHRPWAQGQQPNLSELLIALHALNDREKHDLLEDTSPDGWAYSTQLAHFTPYGLTIADVMSALPNDPASMPRVPAFIGRFADEMARYRPPATPKLHGHI